MSLLASSEQEEELRDDFNDETVIEEKLRRNTDDLCDTDENYPFSSVAPKQLNDVIDGK